MKDRKKQGIGRRDMFRMMGAGGAAALSSGLTTAASEPQNDPTRKAAATAWKEVNETDRQRSRLWQQRMDWWLDARFGMFIHWGLYAEAAGYWNGKPVPFLGEW
ncbi:MAG: alpha-L-fucosidase, partial [Limisphaerales bacterium]